MEIRTDRIKDLRRVRAGDLQPDPRNWRRHPKAQRDALAATLDRIGYVDAVIAREVSGRLVLVDGHLRADLDPEAIVPVLVVDLDEQEAGEVLVTLDPLTAMAEPDTDALQALIDSVTAQSDEALLEVLRNLHAVPSVQNHPQSEEPLHDVPDPKAERGQVWRLGRHRLMCGNSTSAEDVERLLDGAVPRLMVTDPPYGVEYNPEWRTDAWAKGYIGFSAGRKTGKVGNDHRTDWSAALLLSPSLVLYQWCASITASAVQLSLAQGNFDIRNMLVWKKPSFAISRGHYHWQHELCWYAVRKGATAQWIGDRSQSTVWEIPWDKIAVGDHSTQKPLECMERPIRNHEGDVYDPFVGSGTTIIAAERQGRTCYAMEIEPRYVDVAITRWEQYTGEQAELTP